MVLVAAFFVVVCARCSTAADVSCVSTWGGKGPKFDYTGEADLNHFPSGRRPSRATCLEALLKGEIVSGDFNKVTCLVRVRCCSGHPVDQLKKQ
jgi:hypothetical protein